MCSYDFDYGLSLQLFDFEFAFLGHPAFNVALPLACIMLIQLFDAGHVTDEQLSKGLSTGSFKTTCLQAIKNMRMYTFQ